MPRYKVHSTTLILLLLLLLLLLLPIIIINTIIIYFIYLFIIKTIHLQKFTVSRKATDQHQTPQKIKKMKFKNKIYKIYINSYETWK